MGFKDLLNLNPYADLVNKPIKTPPPKKELKPEKESKPKPEEKSVPKSEERPPVPEEEKEEVPRPKLEDLTTTSRLRFAFFIKLFTIIFKDIKLLIRSKSSSLIIIFGPLLVIFLVGMAFNTASLYDLKIATYSDSYSELSDSIIFYLQDEQYSTIKTENLEDCIDGVRLGKFHACAVFSPDMAIGNEAQNHVKINVDESRMSLAHMLERTVQKAVAFESTKISESLTGNILVTMFNTMDVLEGKRKLIMDMYTKISDSVLHILGVQRELQSIDLSYNTSGLNYTDVMQKYDDMLAEINKSEACVAVLPLNDPVLKAFKKSVNNLKDDAESIDERFEAIVGSVVKQQNASMEDLNSLKDTLYAGNDELNILKSTLEDLVAGIQGVEVTDVETIVSPVTTSVQSVTAKKTHLGYQFPTFLILIVMFSSLLFATTVTIREKLSQAFFRNFIMPTSDVLFMFGSYLTNMFIIAIQLGILFVASVYFLPELEGVIWSMALVLLIVASVFVLVGMFLGFVFRSEETATLGAISIGSLMLFFSNAILPIETLPIGIRDIAKFNPFVLSVSVLKRIMLFGANFGTAFEPIRLEVYMLLCFVAIFFILAFVARELTKRMFR